MGVDVYNETVADNMAAFVWEPSMLKCNVITAATEAACLVLSVDETIKAPQNDQGAGQRGRGRGRPMM